jgi:uncharacterized protein (DUF934 family)
LRRPTHNNVASQRRLKTARDNAGEQRDVIMSLFRNATNTFIDDAWHVLADDVPLPVDGRAIVSLKRWRAEQSALIAEGRPIGVRIEAGDTLEPDTDNYLRLDLIVLGFPKFSDGRSYSKARVLRERLAFTGELRATGDVLLDQVPLMQRAGFDTLHLTHGPTVDALKRGHSPGISRTYQATGTSAARRRA